MKRYAVVVLIGILSTGIASGSHRVGHDQPQKAARIAFAGDLPALSDHEWGFRLGGFGGIGRGAPLRHVPVIFVHGNNVDAADWYPVQDAFRAAGWTDQELWALSYNGLGGNNGTALATPNPRRDAEHTAMGWDGMTRVTANDVNVPDLFDFIGAVQTYTGSQRFSIVAHSLGVTLARKTLKVHPSLREQLAAFVAIAGANHGTSFCPPGSEAQVHSCDEIAAGTAWLEDLNGPDGADETFGPAKWLTIYDGSGAGDPAYTGPTYARSPVLKGADNRAFAGTYHNDLRLDPAIVTVYRTFLESAEGAGIPRPKTPPTVRAARRGELPATGGTGSGPLGLLLLAAAGAVGRMIARGRRISDADQT